MSRDRTKKIRIAFAVMIIILMVLFFVSFLLGRYSLSPKDVFCVLGNMIAGKAAPVGSNTEVILTKIRFPRIVMACLVGELFPQPELLFRVFFRMLWLRRMFLEHPRELLSVQHWQS